MTRSGLPSAAAAASAAAASRSRAGPTRTRYSLPLLPPPASDERREALALAARSPAAARCRDSRSCRAAPPSLLGRGCRCGGARLRRAAARLAPRLARGCGLRATGSRRRIGAALGRLRRYRAAALTGVAGRRRVTAAGAPHERRASRIGFGGCDVRTPPCDQIDAHVRAAGSPALVDCGRARRDAARAAGQQLGHQQHDERHENDRTGESFFDLGFHDGDGSLENKRASV